MAIQLPEKNGPVPDLKAIGEALNADKVFCMIPWVHLHVMPNSTVIPCCVWPYTDVFGDGKTQDAKTIWNSEKYRELRRNMLEGKASKGCERCYSVEKAGFTSMRQTTNMRFAEHAEVIKKTAPDGSFPELRLRYIDIRFSNLCNFRCRGCGPDLSSAWYDDHQALYNFKSDKPRVMSIATDSPDFWRELKAMIPDAEEIYFGGGEPLITREHFEVLKLLTDLGRTDIRLSYNTNLSTLSYGNHDLADIWSKFEEVTIGISLDDIGARAEYFRNGTKWSVIESNMRRLRDEFPGIHRYINCTVNIHNVLYLPEIVESVVGDYGINPSQFFINLLLNPDEYVLHVLPTSIKSKIQTKLQEFEKLCHSRAGAWTVVGNNMRKVLAFMEEKDSSDSMPSFRERTRSLDRIRSEAFVKTFPELAELMEE